MNQSRYVLAVAAGLLASTALAQEPQKPVSFYRGINLNGPALVIDGQKWEGKDAKNYKAEGKVLDNPSVPLKPKTDRNRAKMISTSVWEHKVRVSLTDVPSGKYTVFAYVWEDNNAEVYSVSLNGRVVIEKHNSGGAGVWEKLGPFVVNVSDGVIRLETDGGHANVSGLEVWSGEGKLPVVKSNEELLAVKPLSSDQVEFFEKRVRPIFANRCYECHSATAKELGGGLYLDSRLGVLKGGDSGAAIDLENASESLLLKAVRYKDADLQMPPDGKIPDTEIADLEAWIKRGASDPRNEDTKALAAKKKAAEFEARRDFWSLRPVNDHPVPTVKNGAWPLGDIDRFLLAKLEERGLVPAPPAAKRTLIRRATYDLTGLPPSPEEVDAYLKDDSPDAFAKVVNRLLASRHYGERWGRHWLDVVRYADTAGDNSDYPIPQMYKYRNWVIEAINDDLPYDQFVRTQLAGDLLPSTSEEDRYNKLIATGYLANSRRFGSYEDTRYPWHLTIEDTIDNLGRTFLAQTINCCRCHDHKFDPFSNEDYYALYGFFQSTRYPWPGIELDKAQHDLVPLAPDEQIAQLQKERKEKLAAHDVKIDALEAEQKTANAELKAAGEAGDDEEKKAKIAELTKRLDELKKAVKDARKEKEDFSRQPLPYELAYAVAEASTTGKKQKIGNACVQIKGDPERLGVEVPRRFPSVLGGHELSEDSPGSGRLDLARWITDPANPLTARVMVNRIWHYHFGKGIVETPSDFGKQGKLPTHPELLDYLARQFIGSGWSLKAMHRQIMFSRAYQMAHVDNASQSRLDPGNDYLWRFNRHRLDAESIRDTLLAVSGGLDLSIGGPHTFPEQKSWDFTQHKPFKAVYDSNRRSVYLMTQRIVRHPFLALFDGPDTNAGTARRVSSTTPLQSLYFMNDPWVHEQAGKLAARLSAERSDERQRIERAYQLLFGRPAEPEEQTTATAYLAQLREKLSASGVPAEQRDAKAWESLVCALLMSNEFVYVN